MYEHSVFKPYIETDIERQSNDKTDYLSNCLCSSICFDTYPKENQFKALFELSINGIEYNAELTYYPSGCNVFYLFDSETGDDVLEYKEVPFTYNKKKLNKEVEQYILSEIDSIDNSVDDSEENSPFGDFEINNWR